MKENSANNSLHITAVIKEPYSKSKLIATLAERTDLTKKDISNVIDELSRIIEGHIKRNAAGVFMLPGLLKMRVVSKPATKKRKGINPFTGEAAVFKAKPAYNVVKIRALKTIKDMAL